MVRLNAIKIYVFASMFRKMSLDGIWMKIAEKKKKKEKKSSFLNLTNLLIFLLNMYILAIHILHWFCWLFPQFVIDWYDCEYYLFIFFPCDSFSGNNVYLQLMQKLWRWNIHWFHYCNFRIHFWEVKEQKKKKKKWWISNVKMKQILKNAFKSQFCMLLVQIHTDIKISIFFFLKWVKY